MASQEIPVQEVNIRKPNLLHRLFGENLQTARRQGTKNQGTNYEIKICALLALRCLDPDLNVKNFWLAQNINNIMIGDFDDVILTTENQKGEMYTYCMQLKHFGEVERKRTLKYDTFCKEYKSRKKNPFNLESYFRSISTERNRKLNRKQEDNLRYILYTNKDMDKTENRFKPCEDDDVDLLNTGGNAFCFHEFKYKKSCKSETDQVDGFCEEHLDSKLLKKLVILCAQEHEENMRCIISKSLRKILKIDEENLEDITDKYILYISDWMNGEYGDSTVLLKEMVKYHLVNAIVKPYIYQLHSPVNSNISEEIMEHYHGILKSYNLVVVENFNPHENTHKDCIEIMSRMVQRTIKKYANTKQSASPSKRSSRIFGSKEKISSDDQLLFKLWNNGKVHLMMKAEIRGNLEQILTIIKFVPSAKFIIFCDSFGAAKINEDCKVLKTFRDLERDHREFILQRDVTLQGRNVKLKDVLWKNNHKGEVELSVVQIAQVLMNKFSLGVGKTLLQLPDIFISRSLESVMVNSSIFNERFVHVIACENKKAFQKYAKSVQLIIEESQVYSLFNCSHAENSNKYNKLISSSGQVSIKSDFSLPTEYSIVLVKEEDLNFMQKAINKQKIDNTIFKTYTLNYYFKGVYKITENDSNRNINVVFTDVKQLKSFFANDKISYSNSEIYDVSKIKVTDIPINCKYLTCSKEEFHEKLGNHSLNYSLNFYNLNEDSKSNFTLEWLGSNKSCKNIRKYKYSLNESHYYDINECYKYNKVNLIWGSPGIGKTVLINYLAGNCPSDIWSVKVYFNEHLKYYDNKTIITTSAVDHVKYFLKYQILSSLEQTFVDEYIVQKRICLYFDGFDEIAPDFEDPVCNLLKMICKAGFILFVTSRPLQVAMLELRLHAIARTIQPFTTLNQLEYVSKYFKSMIEHADDKVDEYVNELLSKRNEMTSLDEQFSGVPLQTLMIANIYLSECREYCNGNKSITCKNVDVLHLYEQFIEYKFKEFETKHKLDENMFARNYFRIIKVQSMDLYKICAVKAVFPFIHFELGEEAVEFLNEIKSGKEKLGLIERVNDENIPVFVHRTFAEYLSGIYLANNFEKTENKQLLSTMFKDKGYDVIRNIFDRLLAKKCSLHTALLNRDETTVIKLLNDGEELNKVDGGGRNVLHLAMSWGARHVVPENNLINILGDDDTPNNFISKLKNMHNLCREQRNMDHLLKLILTKGNKLLRKKDAIFTETPLDYGIRVMALSSVDIFLGSVFKIDKTLWHFRKSLRLLYEFRVKASKITNFLTKKTDFLSPEIMDHKQLLFLCSLYDYYNLSRTMKRMKPAFGHIIDFQYGEWELPYLLHLAAFYRSDRILRKLVKKGLDVDIGDRLMKNTPLHWAAKMGNVSTVRLLLSLKANVNAINIYDVTPLMYAALEKHTEIVRMLLLAGADVDATDSQNLTALNLATKYGHVEVENVIINQTNDEVKYSYKKNIILMRAAEKGHVEVVRLLFSSGLDINAVNTSGWTALMYASMNGHFSVVYFLIDAGADVNAADYNNETVLMRAASKGHFKVAVLLLKNEADVNARNDNKETAFILASSEGHVDVMRLLLDKGALVDDADKYGRSALMCAAQNGQYDAVKLLLESGADVNATNSGGWTALMYAALKGYVGIVRLLTGKDQVEEEASYAVHLPTTPNHSMSTMSSDINSVFSIKADLPFKELLKSMNAVTNYVEEQKNILEGIRPRLSWKWESETIDPTPEPRFDVFRKIRISEKFISAHVNAVNNIGWTALMYSAFKGHAEVVQELLQLDIDINATDKNGESALMLASKSGHINVIKMLLHRKANVKLINNNGMNALQLANKFNQPAVVKILHESLLQ